MGRDPWAGRSVLGHPHLRRALLVLTLCTAGAGCGQSPPADCLPPTAEGLKADAARSQFVARVVVTATPLLEQGTTSAGGYLLRTEETLSGQAPPPEFALWPAIDTPQLAKGQVVVVFAGPGRAAGTEKTTADGAEVKAFHVAVSNGVIEPRGGEVVRMCRSANSEPASGDVLGGL